MAVEDISTRKAPASLDAGIFTMEPRKDYFDPQGSSEPRRRTRLSCGPGCIFRPARLQRASTTTGFNVMIGGRISTRKAPASLDFHFAAPIPSPWNFDPQGSSEPRQRVRVNNRLELTISTRKAPASLDGNYYQQIPILLYTIHKNRVICRITIA